MGTMIDVLNYKLYGDVTVYDVAVVVFVMAFATIIAKIVTTNLRRALIDKMRRDQLELMLKIIYFGIIIIAFIAVLPALGLNLSGLLVAGGITGIILGFASQSVVSNLVSGIFLLWEKPIKIGDQISIDGVMGFVEDVNVLSTIIRTYDGLYVRIPNEKLFTSNITNYVAHIARRFEYVIGIRYSDDAEKAIEIIKKLIEEHPFVLKNPEPQVFVDNLGESSVNIIVRVWAPSTEWYSVKMEMLWKIKTELEKNGIEIPFPQRVVWFANELRANVSKEEGRQT
uniref:Mechanosensitive ion channel family protein n=1 Tax=Archaeoglobus fulgidus TaxID=2234 RepID=A0A7C2SEW6_ARCFL